MYGIETLCDTVYAYSKTDAGPIRYYYAFATTSICSTYNMKNLKVVDSENIQAQFEMFLYVYTYQNLVIRGNLTYDSTGRSSTALYVGVLGGWLYHATTVSNVSVTANLTSLSTCIHQIGFLFGSISGYTLAISNTSVYGNASLNTQCYYGAIIG